MHETDHGKFIDFQTLVQVLESVSDTLDKNYYQIQDQISSLNQRITQLEKHVKELQNKT